MLEKVKAAVRKVEKAAERQGIIIDLIEIREEMTGPNGEYFPPTASVWAGREILVYIHRDENIYALISKEGDVVRRYKVAGAAIAAADKLDKLDDWL